MCSKAILRVIAVASVLVWGFTVQAEVVIETVFVANVGNPDDTHGDGYGGVDYVYSIGKFEITAGQYTEFLNAVAATDTYGLYNQEMWTNEYGCKIRRTGDPDSYTYLVDADGDDVEDAAWVDRPVNFVSWGDAARFVNWLHNGQPTGAQVLSTTEDGSYYLDGATSNAELLAVDREEDATWVIPSEDEWYKAAYHYNDGVTGSYYDYPTCSDTVPVSEPCAGGSNSANYLDGDYAVGAPYYRNEVGCYVGSASCYGTFDQGGNLWEWNEAVFVVHSERGIRGGAFNSYAVNDQLRADYRTDYLPTEENAHVGFRVVEALEDCNDNGIPDECDLDCGTTDGPCDIDGCGQSQDNNGDGIPDECGACCGSPGDVACTQLTQTLCEGGGGVYVGDGTVCEGLGCPIPTISEWGLVAMTLLVLGAGTVVLRRRRGVAGS